ncbi:VOC family protein [Lujinxingia vulgaris]|uniref:VOC family protein n=1 Tax=Lujinxingia vulgaris TaxID=2600176 RepID=A0A5C6WXQ2_9DELT|nr:VOC family protein [Lujinxingia vulgaris]TXD33084.1 VOC family protein [Lujinxingia vulgaris]
MSMFKPESYPSLSPYLIVADAREVGRFLETVFDATILREHTREDGSVMHVEYRIDDSVVMMGEAQGDWASQPTHLHVYVPDAMAVYERALASGAEGVQPPEKKPDGDMRGGFKGPGGNTWWVATEQR